MPSVDDAVRSSIERHHLVSPGEVVVVGVSGGPDSLCLLHVLRGLRADYSLALHVAHLHHGLRGAEADEDAEFVRALAAEWQLGCTIERVDVAALASRHHLSWEEAARRARYGFLWRVADVMGSGCIAVGHNADDQTETVMMHWIRGSGLAGLRGMLPVTLLSEYRRIEDFTSRSPGAGFRLVRPLLEVTRAEIEAYCAIHELKPRFDRSNLDTTYFRNWLRHEVLPLLASHNPNVGKVLRRSAQVLADDYALLRSLLLDTWPSVVRQEEPERIVLDLEGWRALPTSLQRSTIREAVQRLRRTLRDVGFIHVENALVVARDGATGDQSTLPQGLMLTVGYDQLVVGSADVAPSLPDWPMLAAGSDPMPVLSPGRIPLPGSSWQLEVSVVARGELSNDWALNRDRWRAFVDAGLVGLRLWLRTRQTGDRFQPLGMNGHTVKLSDFLINQKVPHVVRDQLPLVVGERGIVWVCGQRIDERARVRDGTETVLVLRFVQQEVG
ncbi:MAG: tRNA lysidine(34) synthetase TilS [Anaerolineae bacterium]|jgi:tRNA(Ile)-lysidine synthase